MAAKFCFENLGRIYIQFLLAMIFVSFGYIYEREAAKIACIHVYIYAIAILVPVKILGDC
jgi:hypothetical protein